jgi:hypothetical protein
MVKRADRKKPVQTDEEKASQKRLEEVRKTLAKLRKLHGPKSKA